MLTQVGTLAAGMHHVRSLAAAPDAVLQRLESIAVLDRLVLPPVTSPWRLITMGIRCGRWARAQGADLIHGHGLRWSPLFAIASLFGRLPLVVTLHNLVPERPSAVARMTMRLCVGRSKRIIAVSQAIAATAAATLGSAVSQRLRVVRNGIDLRPFQGDFASDRAEARRRLQIPEGFPVALCVARLSPEKNVAAFIDAAEKMSVSRGELLGPSCRFLIAGDGPQREALESRVRNTPDLHACVTFLGRRADISALMCASDVICVPSREEGLGLAAIEAMAAGRPVIATRIGGLAEVVIDNETGLLIPLGELSSRLADALAVLISDPARRERMGNAGRARARAEFGSERMIAETRDVYDEALAA